MVNRRIVRSDVTGADYRLARFALEQLAARLGAEGDDAFTRSRHLRREHADADERFAGDADAHYELGYAEGRAVALKGAATSIAAAAEALPS